MDRLTRAAAAVDPRTAQDLGDSEMALGDAINHLKETLADPAHNWLCPACKAEHEQLLTWLQELQALRVPVEAVANEPLTLEQLREMDGEPVWVDEPDGYKSYSGWALVYVAWRGQSVIYFVRANGATRLCAPLLHSGGKAYRRKPKEADR